MVALSQFYSAVATHVPAAPTPTLDEAIVNAAIEFCTRTQLVVETIQADAELGEGVVYFTPSSDQLAVRFISSVWYKDSMLAAVPDTNVYTPKAWVEGTAPQAPTAYFYAAQSNYINVYPVPASDDIDAFTARVVVVPVRGATTLPDVLYNEWLTAVAAGARAYIKSIPGQPFSGDPRPDMAVFRHEMSDAMAQVMKGRVLGNLRVRPGASAFFPKRY